MTKSSIKTGIFILLFIAASLSCSREHFIKNRNFRARISEMLAWQINLANGQKKQLFSVFDQKLNVDEREALAFLYAFMPLSDMGDYDGKFYLENVRFSLKAIAEIPWVKNIPEDIFLNFVLPIRVNNENLDSFRMMKYEELKNRVKSLSMKDAALEINHWCHEQVNYCPSDIRTSSPLSTMKTSWGRCGEESVFTVAALRTVGIPARQVYTPRWAHTDDNHAWVEVWINGKWYYLGACEPEPDLNMAWFTEPARRAMLVHTRAYGCYFGDETVIQSNKRFAELNLIKNYAPVKTFKVKINDMSGKPVSGASVRFLLYNYAEFYPLAEQFTGKSGEVRFTSGLGDLIIWASKDSMYGFRKISVEKTDTVNISITANHSVDFSVDYNIIPPVQPLPLEVNENGKIKNQKRLNYEDSIRAAYRKSFPDSVAVINFAVKMQIDKDTTWKVLKKVYGNPDEIFKFLSQKQKKEKQWALKMLLTLSDKDLRDCKAATLNDHLHYGLINNNNLASTKPDFFAKYVLSPRIGNEMIRPWRSFLQSKFDKNFIAQSGKDISKITVWIKQNIKTDDEANLLSRCPISPSGVFGLRTADGISRDIFFVALCRSFGIPARLNPVNSIPQYFNENNWIDVLFNDHNAKEISKGYIHLVNVNNGFIPKYNINFTIAKLNDGIYKTLEFDEEMPINKFPDQIEVDAGKYMMVTGNRLTGGSVLTRVSFFEVWKNKTSDINVKVRTIETKPEKAGKLLTDGIILEKFDDHKPEKLENIVNGKGVLIIFINPGEEPTRHIISDLPASFQELEKWKGNIIIILPAKAKHSSFSVKDFRNIPSRCLFAFDNDNKIMSGLETLKGYKLHDNLPVILISDPMNNIIYFSQGYTIGIGEQISEILKQLK